MNPTALFAVLPPLAVYLGVALCVGAEGVGIPLPGETALIAGGLPATAPASPVSIWWAGLVAVVSSRALGRAFHARAVAHGRVGEGVPA